MGGTLRRSGPGGGPSQNFLGLNGFSMVFWQFNWEFLKEVVENFGEFHGVGLLRVLMPFLPFYVSS